MIVVYGIKSCDTCRKALTWLRAQDRPHRFHDLRAEGLAPETLDAWLAAVGWERLLNRRGTTWRRLPAPEKADLDAAKARALLLAHPTLIKRPVFALPDGRVLVGFGAAEQRALAAGRHAGAGNGSLPET